MLKLSFLEVNSKVAESLNYLGKEFVLSVMPLAAHPQLAPGGIHRALEMSKQTLCPGVLPGLIVIRSPELPGLAAVEPKSADCPLCVPWTWQGWCFHGPTHAY